jgi:hypothetical protein
LTSVVLSTFPARLSAAPSDDDFHLKYGGGIWATSLNGTVGVRNVQSDVDADFGDLLDKLNFALSPRVELGNREWVLLFQGTIAKLEDSRTFRDGRGGDIDAALGVFNLGVGYNLVHTEIGNNIPLTITPMVGGQITSLKLELDPRNGDSVDRSRTWFDPYIGGRAIVGLTQALDWRTEATIGGFGVGSELTWAAGTYLDWEFARGWSLNVGYRAVNWDYDQDNFKWDMTMHGPWLGLTYEWF